MDVEDKNLLKERKGVGKNGGVVNGDCRYSVVGRGDE